MNTGQKWIRRPQRLWLRRAFFQVHLWTGIGIGLYVVLMSVSGSAVVFRRELSRKLSPPRVIDVGSGNELSQNDLKLAVQRSYPDYEVLEIFERKAPNRPVEIMMVRGPQRIERLFNPYTGADLGDPLLASFRLLEWTVDLHDNLLFGRSGRLVNAAGGILTTLLCLTGLVIWWPGSDRWRRSLTINWKTNLKNLNWMLHSALGFWTFAFVFMWGLSGIYISIPISFTNMIDALVPGDGDTRKSDLFLWWLARLHFGRFAGTPMEIAWTIFGLMPVVLFVTGTIMWWNRVLRPWRLRTRALERVHQVDAKLTTT